MTELEYLLLADSEYLYLTVNKTVKETVNEASYEDRNRKVLLQKIKKIETGQTYSKFLSNLYNNTHYIFDKVKLTKARTDFFSNLTFFHHM